MIDTLLKAAESADLPNTTSTPAVLTLDTPVQSRFEGEGDRDWFRVELLSGEIYTATVTLAEPATGFGGFEGRAELYVDNATLKPFFVEDVSIDSVNIDEGETTSVAVLAVETDGLYYLDLESFFSSGDYTVELALVEEDLPTYDSGVELEPGVPLTSNFYGPADADSFSATLKEGAVYGLTFDLPDTPYVAFEGSAFPRQEDQFVYFDVNSNEPYFSFVAAHSDVYDFTFTNYANAYDYTVTLEELPQSDDIGDTPETAQPLAVNETVESRFEVVGGDADWFALSLDAGTSYFLQMDREGRGYWGGSDAVPVLQIRADDGTLLSETIQTSGLEIQSDIFTPDTSGIYYAAVIAEMVRIYNIDGDPDYSLTLYSADPITATGSAGDDLIEGSFAADSLGGAGGNDTLNGAPGDDTILGGAGRDAIAAATGDDFVDGGTGNDIIGGGPGTDTLIGGEGDDLIASGRGDDLIDGGDGADLLWGGEGRDTISGGEGDDHIGAGFEADSVDGGAGNDLIGGGHEGDVVAAGAGNDTVWAGQGNDSVTGGAGDDSLKGGGGDDVLDGGDGADTLEANWGNDTLTGGAGADTIIFEFRAFPGNSAFIDTSAITDFESGIDRIVFKIKGPDGPAPEVMFEAGLTRIVVGEDIFDLVTLDGATLSAADFDIF